jgi:hypothetical protein
VTLPQFHVPVRLWKLTQCGIGVGWRMDKIG